MSRHVENLFDKLIDREIPCDVHNASIERPVVNREPFFVQRISGHQSFSIFEIFQV
jgi:hypothetical protein